MERIKQQETHAMAIKVRTWIVYAVWPLRLEELQHAIATDELEPDDSSITEECLTSQSILINSCAGLVKVNEKSNTIGLVHKTTYEYFDRTGATHFPQAELDLATACVKYLSLEEFSDGPCSSREQYYNRVMENPLFEYAATNLGNHMVQVADDSVPLDFFLDKRKWPCISQALFLVTYEWRCTTSFCGISRLPGQFYGMHYAAYFGLTGIVGLLLQNADVDPDTPDSDCMTPLSWASANGHTAVVSLLVANLEERYHTRRPLTGAAINRALYCAAANGHEAVIRLLFETGRVEVDSRRDNGWTPLFIAAANGEERALKLLIDSGMADVDVADNGKRRPIFIASSVGHEGIVRVLLETGKVNVNYPGLGGQTPIHRAATRGHEGVMRLLLETGMVDLNQTDMNNETPMELAARRGHESIVRLLQSYIEH